MKMSTALKSLNVHEFASGRPKEYIPRVVGDALSSERHMTNKTRKIAEELKERLLACDGTRIQRVLLYGSRARDTASDESDFDLLVVEKDPVVKREEMARLRQAVTDQHHLVVRTGCHRTSLARHRSAVLLDV